MSKFLFDETISKMRLYNNQLFQIGNIFNNSNANTLQNI